MKTPLYAGVLLAVLSLGLGSAAAQTTGFNETGGTSSSSTAATGLTGFNFTLNAAINVTQLGFYGSSLSGGDTPWVALYDVTTSTLLASFTSTSTTNYGNGSGNYTNGQPGWAYVSLSVPVTLNTTDTYQVVAETYTSPLYASTSGFTYGSAISSESFLSPTGGWGGWGTPQESSGTATATPNIAANFIYTSAIPEPSTYAALLGLAALGFVVVRRRRRS